MAGEDRTRSSLMVGRVWHKRHQPRPHAFAYSVFYCLFDLDELDVLQKKHRFFSVNRWNLFSLFPNDYGLKRNARSAMLPSLKSRVAGLVKAEFGVTVGRVQLLTMPRVLGYAFNPISVYYCHDTEDQLSHVIYEVNNTFGERFSYAFEVQQDGDRISPHRCEKQLHVSPFFEVEGGYKFSQQKTDKHIKLAIDYSSSPRKTGSAGTSEHLEPGGDTKTFSASMSLEKIRFTTANLLLTSARIPFVTAKVIIAIHWQALKLWIKNHRIFTKPTAPDASYGVAGTTREGQHI